MRTFPSGRVESLVEHIHSLGAYTQSEEVAELAKQRDALRLALQDAADLREADLDTADEFVTRWRELAKAQS